MKNCGCADGANLKLGRCEVMDSAGLAAMVGLAVFVKVEKIGVTGGAGRGVGQSGGDGGIGNG